MSLLVDGVSYNIKSFEGRTEEDIRITYSKKKKKHLDNLIFLLKDGNHLKKKVKKVKEDKTEDKEGGE
jgi:riboflavin synthase